MIHWFDSHYDHQSMLMENFLWSMEYENIVEIGVIELGSRVVLTKTQQKRMEE